MGWPDAYCRIFPPAARWWPSVSPGVWKSTTARVGSSGASRGMAVTSSARSGSGRSMHPVPTRRGEPRQVHEVRGTNAPLDEKTRSPPPRASPAGSRIRQVNSSVGLAPKCVSACRARGQYATVGLTAGCEVVGIAQASEVEHVGVAAAIFVAGLTASRNEATVRCPRYGGYRQDGHSGNQISAVHLAPPDRGVAAFSRYKSMNGCPLSSSR